MARRDRKRKRRPKNQDVPGSGELHRANEPGSLDHASGATDEIEAKIVAGAGGEVAGTDATDEVLGVDHPEELSPEEFSRLEDDVDAAEIEIEDSGAIDADLELDNASRATAHQVEAPSQKGPRFIRFLRSSWAELQRVQWPDRRQVSQATAVVLGFVVIAGAYLGLADYVAKQVVNFII